MKIIYYIFTAKANLFERPILGFLDSPKLNLKSWSVVFFGSDNFSLVSLKVLHRLKEQKVLSNLEVVSSSKTPVYKYSITNNFLTHSWLPNLNGTYDFGIIVSFGKLIPKSIIDKFPLGILNVHGSLLPKYRGGMPIVHAIKNGETSTGITITKIRADKFDVGEIIMQKSCSIDKNELMPSLYDRMAVLGSECLLEVLLSMPECLKNSVPQVEHEASYAPKIKKESAVVSWGDMTALEIFNLYRALFGLFELTSIWNGEEVKFVHLSLSNTDQDFLDNKNYPTQRPGWFTFNKKSKVLYVQCKDKAITVSTLRFNMKLYKANDFYNGYLHNTPSSVWKFGSQ